MENQKEDRHTVPFPKSFKDSGMSVQPDWQVARMFGRMSGESPQALVQGRPDSQEYTHGGSSLQEIHLWV